MKLVWVVRLLVLACTGGGFALLVSPVAAAAGLGALVDVPG